jgi:hypothetical protein
LSEDEWLFLPFLSALGQGDNKKKINKTVITTPMKNFELFK